MKFNVFAKYVYLPLALVVVFSSVFFPLTGIFLGFVISPIAISIVCLHYLIHKRKSAISVAVPRLVRGLFWLSAALLVAAVSFIGFILFSALTGTAAPYGASAAWALLMAPLIVVPGVLFTIIFFFFNRAAQADIRANNNQQFTPSTANTSVPTSSYVEKTGITFLFILLFGSLILSLEYYEYTNFFGPEKLYTIESLEFSNNDSIFYIQARPQPSGSTRPYIVHLRANSGKDDEQVGSLTNWKPDKVLFYEDTLYSVFNDQEIDGVLRRNVQAAKNVGGGWAYDGSSKKAFRGDVLVSNGEVFVFEFIDSTCELGVYQNCRGNMYPANSRFKNELYYSKVRNNVSYAEFSSSQSQVYEYLLIKDGTLVPGNSPLFDEVSGEFEIVPITIETD